MTIEEKEQQLIEEFSLFDNWIDKYNYIIELGKTLPIIDAKNKSESNLITGCQSKVWLNAEYNNGKVIYTADSEALITKGIISIIIRLLSNQTPDEIINSKLDVINTIGLKEHLSPTRANGLLSMIKQMKAYALAFKAKYE